jgi:hypothetical protein
VSAGARAEILRRARGYPYDAPHESFTWENGAVRVFDPADRAGRTPVLAFGSNRAPERLEQKFGRLEGHRIPVEQARLTGFDVVYAAHITSYGAVPAMLQAAAGVTASIAVTWLDAEQLPIMHATELGAANYRYARLDGIDLQLAGGDRFDHAFFYVSARGHLRGPEGRPHPLLAVHADGRPDPGIATGEALEAVRSRVAPESDPDDFVLRLAGEAVYRHAVTAMISKDAVPFAAPYTVLEA